MKGRQSGDRDAFIDAIDATDGRGIDDEHPARFGHEVAAPGKGSVKTQVGASEAAGNAERGLILLHVARFDLRDDDLGDSGGKQRADMVRAEAFAFLQGQSGPFDRMGEQRALRFFDRRGTKSHAARSDFADGE